MSRGRPVGRRVLLGLALAALASAGCVSETTRRTSEPRVLLDRPATPRPVEAAGADASSAAPSASGRPDDPPSRIGPYEGSIATRVPTFTATVRAEVQPRGAIAYDELALPLVSPDATRLAVEVGRPPDWSAVVADADAAPPRGTRVEILSIASEDAVAPRPVGLAYDGVLLGRSAADGGVLVERVVPRDEGGGRWIGLAPWTRGGEILWLARDDRGTRHAFGCLAPDGTLAFSRATRGEDDWSLEVRPPGGPAFTLASPGESWLMPVFSGAGRGLFVLVLTRDGRLDLVHVEAESEDVAWRSLTRTELASGRATVDTAYQVLAATSGPVVPATGEAPPLFFAHPARGVAACWRPDEPSPTLLGDEAIAAFPADEPGRCLVATPDHLVRRAIDEPRDRVRVIAGLHVVRPTANPRRPFVLFQPSGSRLGVTILLFAPVGEGSPRG